MLDFLRISAKYTKNGVEVRPKFRMVNPSKDLMIRGRDFYAIWDEANGVWSTNEQDVIRLVDEALDEYCRTNPKEVGESPTIFYMWDADSGIIDKWHKYCQKQMRDCYHQLDETIIFANDPVKKEDYASKRLPYSLAEGDLAGWNTLTGTLYSQEELRKIEWAIGAIVTGDSKTIQKFVVFYGDGGTGKSTIMKIIEGMFKPYCKSFEAKTLSLTNAQFSLEPFKDGPLVAIQQDGDLSKIEDNTRLNSLISHENMTVNEKFKSAYDTSFKCFLFMGTNKPVKITDAKSGIIRRLIDIHPTGKKLPKKEYDKAYAQAFFEFGAIAYHCREVYLSDPGYYDDYIPVEMIESTNDFYNFIIRFYSTFHDEESTSAKTAFERYKLYCEETSVPFQMSFRAFKEELKTYFWKYEYDVKTGGTYRGFREEKFKKSSGKKSGKTNEIWLDFKEQKSIFDELCKDCPAQYANESGTPQIKWDNVKGVLSDLDTSKLHYVKIPENHIVIDFDIPDEKGEKSLEKNLKAASEWPPTYAELSKSGKGIHLHYIYNGDVSKLSRVYADHIEIKVFNGKSSLRRLLTKCVNLSIAVISSNLPMKGEKVAIQEDVIKDEQKLRAMINKNLRKGFHADTTSSIHYIADLLDKAYEKGMHYDVSNMANDIIAFAAGSTHQAEHCLKIVSKMKFKSDDVADPKIEDAADGEKAIVFYDCEVFPNLLLINWKAAGKDYPVVRMINPTGKQIEDLCQYRLIDFNGRRYDRHILYARMMGYNNEQIYDLSQRIISGDRNAGFAEAINIGYADVYDICTKKQSLKKWEIELSKKGVLGVKHHELGLPWDQPVPEELWTKVAEYCDDDVLATEAVWNERQGDVAARQIQVDIVKELHNMTATINDTTNSLSGKIIFGKNRKPQDEFNWRDLSKPVPPSEYDLYRRKFGPDYIFRVFDNHGLPQYRDFVPGEKLPVGWSILPFFPKYRFEYGKSYWIKDEKDICLTTDELKALGEDHYDILGEGGRVFGAPGMYGGVWDGDVASMHPHSAIYEVIFGPKHTKVFQEIVNARVAIKHHDFELAGTYLGGALKPYLTDELADDLAAALKIVINSVYGLTSASFPNVFRDPNNIDNIVAKRGALVMTLLKEQVEKLGYSVAHIKTDSIKIPDADDYIRNFVVKFGLEFGYKFETEAEFDKFCLVNDAVYIAKEKGGKHDGEWTATGKQFAVPYVYKTLFTHEDITYDDMCETFAVSKGTLYLDFNETLPDVSAYEKEWAKAERDYNRGKINDTTFNDICDALRPKIAEGHDYHFVGRVGQFTPVKPGHGAGTLYRMNEDKYYAAPGSTGYRWLESEFVRQMDNYMDVIDRSFYDKLVNDAVETISKYGDFEWFISDEPYISTNFINVPEGVDDEIPWN